jgi:hypothetical protein
MSVELTRRRGSYGSDLLIRASVSGDEDDGMALGLRAMSIPARQTGLPDVPHPSPVRGTDTLSTWLTELQTRVS